MLDDLVIKWMKGQDEINADFVILIKQLQNEIDKLKTQSTGGTTNG